MLTIQTLNTIAPVGLAEFPHDKYQISSEIKNPDAILVRSCNMHSMNIPDSVKVVGRAGAGVNTIPISLLTKRGIPVLNTPGANANAVRELVLAGMLLASRNICQAWDYVNTLKNTEEMNQKIEQNKQQFVGFELMGKTLGVIGLGNVGVKVANTAIHLGMRVIGFDPTITVKHAWELSANVLQAHQLQEVLKECDFITFHVPLTNETKQMIGAQELNVMKNNVVLLNFSRDEIMNNESLLHALTEKKVHRYVTDFPNALLQNSLQVISLPHLGASTQEAEENCAVMIAKQVRDFFENGTITHSVNFPTIEMPFNKLATRLAIANLNIPNMVAQISSKLAEAGLNIVSLLNKSREEIAYTLIDVNSDVSEGLLQAIKDIQGVVQVRKINSSGLSKQI